MQAAAQANGLQLRLLNASTPAELEAAFAAIDAQRPDALLVGGDPFFLVQRHYIAEQVARACVCRRSMRSASWSRPAA